MVGERAASVALGWVADVGSQARVPMFTTGEAEVLLAGFRGIDPHVTGLLGVSYRLQSSEGSCDGLILADDATAPVR